MEDCPSHVVKNQSSLAVLWKTAVKGGRKPSSDLRRQALVPFKVIPLLLQLSNIPLMGTNYIFQIAHMHIGKAIDLPLFLYGNLLFLQLFLQILNLLPAYGDFFLLLLEIFRAHATLLVSPDILLLSLSMNLFLENGLFSLAGKKLRLVDRKQAEEAFFVLIF